MAKFLLVTKYVRNGRTIRENQVKCNEDYEKKKLNETPTKK